MSVFSIASILLIIFTPSICDLCGVENLPEFRSTGHQQRVLPNQVAALVPSYNFSCAGYVNQWRAHVETQGSDNDRYQITFSVWRRLESRDENCRYAKVGENYNFSLAPEISIDENGTAFGTLTLNVSSKQRVLVRPGDFVGLQLLHYSWLDSHRGQGAAESYGASVMVINGTDVTLWYRKSPFQQACFSENDLVGDSPHTPNQLLPLQAAPVIDVEVEILSEPLDPTPTAAGPTSTSHYEAVASVSLDPLSTISSSVSPTSMSQHEAEIPPTPLYVSPMVTPSTSSNTSVSPTSMSQHEAEIPPTPLYVSPMVTPSTSSNTSVPIIIVITVVGVLACILAILPFLLCMVAMRRKQKQPRDQTPSPYARNTGMMQGHLYNLSSKTMPGYYKRNAAPANCHVYNTLCPPEPLPVLNPALLSDSDSLSTSPTSPNDYELMYSAVLPARTIWKNQPGLSGIECPLYTSILRDAYASKIYQNIEDPTYEVIPAHSLERNDEQQVVYDVVNEDEVKGDKE